MKLVSVSKNVNELRSKNVPNWFHDRLHDQPSEILVEIE